MSPSIVHRLAWTDNLRALMIIFVIVMHAAVTYSGLGSWYYIENEQVDMGPTLFFAFYQTFTQAYFMSLLFLISGYFCRRSIQKKSTGEYLSRRFFRLGIPLLIYVFILHPLNVKMANPDLDLADFYVKGILNLRFFSWTGPMWFVEALLIFDIIYILARKTGLDKIELKLSFKDRNIVILIVLISVFAFLTRLIFPIGSNVSNLQLGFFPAYIVMFFAGVAAHKFDLFSQVSLAGGRKWLILSLAVGIPAWLMIIFFGGPLKGIMLIEGGWNWPALAYACWESFFCVAFIVALSGLFMHRCNKQDRLQQFLSDNAFGVYVFHASILIGISVLVKGIILPPLLKFLAVSILSISISFAFAWAIRKIKPLGKIFS